MKNKILIYISILLLCIGAASCSNYDDFDGLISPSNPRKEKEDWTRVPEKNDRRVFVMFSLGCNDLSHYLDANIKTLEENYLPDYGIDKDVVLIFSHSLNQAPVLFRLYKDENGDCVRETLKTYPDGTTSADAERIKEVLTYAKKNFPAKRYGVLFSSHGTGWAPEKYCYSPADISKSITPFNLPNLGDRPLTKSIGNEWRNNRKDELVEIEIKDFADAIPMKLDYIIFDACFMGGIEVAYQLKDKCEKLCFSQAEILADGMNYKALLSCLLNEDIKEADLKGFARSYYDLYINKPHTQLQTATISVVDCSKLEPLVGIVKKNASLIRSLAQSGDRDKVQRYFTLSLKRYHGIFYDMRDILRMAGTSQEDMDALDSALSECIICKYNTPMLFNEVTLANCCGLSMYLPDFDRTILNPKYPETAWGKATGIIETENT